MRVGVLALQGDFAEHIAILRSMDGKLLEQVDSHPLRSVPDIDRGPVEPIEAVEVRLPDQLAAIDGLILPGGESTTIGKLMVDYSLLEPLHRRIASGMPVFGTCAGAILLARDIGGCDQPHIGVMDLVIRRNAFGRQLQSFETDLSIASLGDPPLRAVFIRAPVIEAVGTGVEVLARLQDGTIVAARQRNMLVTAFHPELTADIRLHRYFIRMVVSSRHLEVSNTNCDPLRCSV